MGTARSRRIIGSCAVLAGASLALVFAVEPASASEPTARRQPAANATLDQLIQDGSFEAGSPNPFWTESSTNFLTPLCTLADCGDGLGTAGPRTGLVWAWFGGVDGP